jgi:hypothetical protein
MLALAGGAAVAYAVNLICVKGWQHSNGFDLSTEVDSSGVLIAPALTFGAWAAGEITCGMARRPVLSLVGGLVGTIAGFIGAAYAFYAFLVTRDPQSAALGVAVNVGLLAVAVLSCAGAQACLP